MISAKTNKKFSEANPEDITNENFPDLIESFDYPNADIADVIKAIGELTGKNFIVDPQVRAKITIIAPSQITVAEAYRAFLSALAINGLTVVPSGAFLKIKTARNAQRDSIETYSGDYFPNSDQMITRIIKLKHISAEEVNKQLRILPSKDGEMVPYPPTNSIIISDYGSNIERVMKIINELDVPGFEEQLEVIRIRYAKARYRKAADRRSSTKVRTPPKASPRFRRRSKQDENTRAAQRATLLAVGDERTNSIIVVGNKAGITKIKASGQSSIFVCAPRIKVASTSITFAMERPRPLPTPSTALPLNRKKRKKRPARPPRVAALNRCKSALARSDFWWRCEGGL